MGPDALNDLQRLCDRFRSLHRADRRAILGGLSRSQRRALRRVLVGKPIKRKGPAVKSGALPGRNVRCSRWLRQYLVAGVDEATTAARPDDDMIGGMTIAAKSAVAQLLDSRAERVS